MKSHHLLLGLALTGVLVVAFFFRFYRIGDVPLGIFFDPAINGLDAIRLMQRGHPVLFFPTNGGREVLFMILLMPYLWLFDTTPFAMRALTATISLLTVAGTVGLLYQLRVEGLRWLVMLGSLALAISYWHIAVSRLGQRPILVPLCAVFTFWFFLRGWHSNRRVWFVWAGIWMGLAGYTYSAARLLPVILVLVLLPELPRLRRHFVNLLGFGLAALIIYAPMGWYLLTHPEQFSARAFSVMVWSFLDTPADIAAELWRNAGRVALFFCCTGSPNPIFGLPSHPGLPLILTPFLLLGLTIACYRWRDITYRLLAVWWILGIVPSIIAIEAPHPLRMIVAVVPTAMLVGLGLLHFGRWFQQRSRPGVFVPALPLLLLLLSIPGTYQAYFIRWPALEQTRGVYDYGAVAIRDAVLEHTEAARPVYLPQARLNDSTLLYYLSGSFQREARLSVSPRETAVVIAPERNFTDAVWVRLHRGTATILPPLTAEGQSLVQDALAAGQPIRRSDGDIAAYRADLATDPAQYLQPPTEPLTATFGPLRLTGASYPRTLDPAEPAFPVTLYWQADESTPLEYEVLVRLVDDAQRAWANGDARPTDWVYPTSFWRPRVDHIAARHAVAVLNESPPPGRYRLAVSLFDPALSQRVPLSDGHGDTFFIGPLKVPRQDSPPDVPLESVGVTFGEHITLAAVHLTPTRAAPGDVLSLTLAWQAATIPARDYTVFVHLLDESGTLATGYDSQPLQGSYPTSIWSPGERVTETRLLPLPTELTPGDYRLIVGVYFQPTGERLRSATADSYTINTVTITP